MDFIGIILPKKRSEIMSIKENVERILKEIPKGVTVEAAAKTKTAEEIEEAIQAGITIIGQNYMKDFKNTYWNVRSKAEWHFIGSCKTQKHDLLKPKFLQVIDMIETIDDYEFAKALNEKLVNLNKTMPVLIEVNSAEESQKSGIMPDDVIEFAKSIAGFENIKIDGLMTMGPAIEPEGLRKYFKLTKELFDELKNALGIELNTLSMGMTDSYKVAIEEGANLVRIGRAIFGKRIYT